MTFSYRFAQISLNHPALTPFMMLKCSSSVITAQCWYAPVDNPEEASLALWFTLSLPVTAAVSPGHAELLWWACDAAEKFKPFSNEEDALIAKKSEGIEPIFPL